MEREIKKSKDRKEADKTSLESEEDLILGEESVLDDSAQEIQEETIQGEEESEGYTYVYGIIHNKDIKIGIKGLKNNSIEKINFKDISALTSLYPTLNPKLKENEAMQHAEILKRLAEKTTIVPMSFGTVFKDQKILETVLSKSYQAIKQTLALIDGKIELGIKVIKNELDNVSNGVTLEILESLNKLSVKSIKGDNFSDRLLLNHSFLVEKNKFSKFSDKIAELEGKYKDLKFIYSGPWPPYSFVNIKIAGS